MSIWITLILCCLIFAGLGFLKGGVRMAFSLAGILLGLFLIEPLGGPFRSLLELCRVTNPIWQALFAPVAIVVVSWLVLMGIGFFVHHKVWQRYTFVADEFTRLQWKRMNKGIGIALGLAAGITVTFALGLFVYVFGYATYKLANDTTNTGLVGFVNKMRADIASTGFDRNLAAIDPVSPNYYKAIDTFAFVYNSPSTLRRLTNYPPLLKVIEQPLFNRLATERGYRELLLGGAAPLDIAKDPTVTAAVQNPVLQEHYRTLDYNDLHNFLRTGKSEKYAKTPIVGRWQADPYVLISDLRRKNPEMTAQELQQLNLVALLFSNLQMIALPNNEFFFGSSYLPPDFGEPVQEEVDASAAAMDERYNITPVPEQAPEGEQASTQPKVEVEVTTSGGGTWRGSGDSYILRMTGDDGEEFVTTATIEETELTVDMPPSAGVPGGRLLFYRPM